MVGYVLIGIFMAFDSERPPIDWKSAQWLPVYLIGMGIISWQGQYSGQSSDAAAADQHRQHPVLVGHPGGGGVQPGHLLLGHGHQAATEEMLELVARQTGEPGELPTSRAEAGPHIPLATATAGAPHPARGGGALACQPALRSG